MSLSSHTRSSLAAFTPADRFGLGHAAPSNRAELAAFATALLDAVEPFLSPGGARIYLGTTGQMYDDDGAALEAYARQLWALVPLLGGGFSHSLAARFAEGMRNGTDPDHPEFWPPDAPPMQQPCVERPALAFALVEAPETFWTPLGDPARQRVVDWLAHINRCEIHPNNWRFFRLITNAAFHRLGLPLDAARVAEDRELLENCYLGDGWFRDGAQGRIDYYIPWAFHFYSALLIRWDADAMPGMDGFAAGARARMAAFAPHFARWFDAEGRGIAFGRSLTYRFAQAAYWGIPALIPDSGIDPATAKGFYLRNLRWWCHQPILSPAGTLGLGYGHAQDGMAEAYNAHGSPYWANKAFLPLLASGESAFWQADEHPFPDEPKPAAQEPAGWNLASANGGHATIVLNGAVDPAPQQDFVRFAEKYAKLAYATPAAFNLATGGRGLEHAAIDATLAFELDGGFWRTRDHARILETDTPGQWSEWEGAEGIQVRCWQGFADGWLLRYLRIEADRPGRCLEGGWPIPAEAETSTEGDPARSLRLIAADRATALHELSGIRSAFRIEAFPNSNLLYRNSCIPALEFRFEPGTHHLASAQPLGFTKEAARKAPPAFERDEQGNPVFHIRSATRESTTIRLAPPAAVG